MFYRIMNRSLGSLSGGFVGVFTAIILIAIYLVPVSAAQEGTNKIEVKDGKVYVNGEMVKELENAELPFVFSGDKSGMSKRMAFFSDSNPHGNAFVFDGDREDFMLGDAPNAFSVYDSGAMEDASRFMWRNGAGPSELMGFRGESKEIRDLEGKSRKLARSYASAEENAKADIEAELKQTLNQIFDLKKEATSERLNKMSTELEKLRTRLSERNGSKSDIVLRRYRQLIGERDSLSW